MTSDEEKIRILFSRISKDEGDACVVLDCFSGMKITYERLRKNLLDTYPNASLSNAKVASQAVLNHNIYEPSLRWGLAILHNKVRASTEAFLTQPWMLEDAFGTDIEVLLKDGTRIPATNLLETHLLVIILGNQ